MRLSDERLREIIDPGTGMSTDEEVALATEVRALRECERFAENMAEHDCAYGDNCPTFGSRHGRCTGCAARAALAAVHALEDKP